MKVGLQDILLSVNRNEKKNDRTDKIAKGIGINQRGSYIMILCVCVCIISIHHHIDEEIPNGQNH